MSERCWLRSNLTHAFREKRNISSEGVAQPLALLKNNNKAEGIPLIWVIYIVYKFVRV